MIHPYTCDSVSVSDKIAVTVSDNSSICTINTYAAIILFNHGTYILRIHQQKRKTILPQITPSIASPAVFYFMYSYLQSSLPLSLVEAARIDGSGEFRTFNSIVLPIMKPAVAVQAIFTFVGSWNNYFVPALIIQSKSKMTVPILIATLRGADYMNFDMGKIYMMITVAIVPIIIVYLLLSKYIIAGVTLGGVKE